MKIFANIPGFAKLLNSLRYMNVNKKVIEDARAAGDFEREREYILKSTSVWGDMVFKMFGSELTVYGEENLPDHWRWFSSATIRDMPIYRHTLPHSKNSSSASSPRRSLASCRFSANGSPGSEACSSKEMTRGHP